MAKLEAATKVLDAVTAIGSSDWVNTSACDGQLCVVVASGVTTGATAYLEGNTAPDGSGTTFEVQAAPFDESGSAVFTSGSLLHVPALRVRIGDYTDGTYTAFIIRRMP